MSTQRYCVCGPAVLRTCQLCGEAFAIVRKAGRPRDYCWSCEPAGWQVVGERGKTARRAAYEVAPASVAGAEDDNRRSEGGGLNESWRGGVNVSPSRTRRWCVYQLGTEGRPSVSTFRMRF